jgi:replicative DNA helicase
MNTLEHALFYAGRGWSVFPLKERDKVPTVKWADVCTTEANMIKGWWEYAPASNIGIATGKKSGITVLDVDASHDGYESLAALIEQYGGLPETPVAKTGGGGEHIFFKYAEGTRNSAGKLGRGLDIRSEGGYVVGASSRHPNGNLYEWVVRPSQVELAEMPEWMIEKLQERGEIKETIQSGGVIDGERNNSLTKLAGSMRRKGHSEDGIFAALQIYNREKCVPPLTDGEVLLIAKSVSRYEPQDEIKIIKATAPAYDIIDEIEAEARERQANPCDVWGIHYAWDFISLLTGGKQKGELIIEAGEPGVGKSWWAHQDALYTAIGNPSKKIASTPVFLWSGEMSRKQVYRRFFDMMGVQKRKLLSGTMREEDWDSFSDAKALIMNSPIYVSDIPLELKNLRGLLEREIGEHGIEQAVFDYDWLISSPGQNEIEQSQNTSRALKQLAREFNISIILISSVNKTGMDSTNENVTKSNVSGSGKKLHDADVIYILTKFNENKNKDLGIMPKDYSKIVTLHISKGRELDYHIPNGTINYMRESPSPKFREMRDVSNSNDVPDWLKRSDLK